jgi:hypothetical protein
VWAFVSECHAEVSEPRFDFFDGLFADVARFEEGLSGNRRDHINGDF